MSILEVSSDSSASKRSLSSSAFWKQIGIVALTAWAVKAGPMSFRYMNAAKGHSVTLYNMKLTIAYEDFVVVTLHCR